MHQCSRINAIYIINNQAIRRLTDRYDTTEVNSLIEPCPNHPAQADCTSQGHQGRHTIDFWKIQLAKTQSTQVNDSIQLPKETESGRIPSFATM